MNAIMSVTFTPMRALYRYFPLEIYMKQNKIKSCEMANTSNLLQRERITIQWKN